MLQPKKRRLEKEGVKDNLNIKSKVKKNPFKLLDNSNNKEDFKGKDTVEFFNYLKETLPPQQYKKFVNQHNLAGNPKINFSKENIRANYNALTNSININHLNIDQYLSELSHAVQNKNGGGNYRPKDFIASIKDVLFNDRKHYDTPGYQEYEAHKVIEKELGNTTGYNMDAANLAATGVNDIDYYSLLNGVINTDRTSFLEKERQKIPSYEEAIKMHQSLKNDNLEALLPKIDDPVEFDKEKKKFDKNYISVENNIKEFKLGGNLNDMRKFKKYFDGGALATATNAVNSAIIQAGQAVDAKKAAQKAAMEAQRDGINNSKKQDLIDSEEFQEEGYALDTYYKLGGGIKTPSSFIKGGKAIPLSSDTVVMKGNKHEEARIDNTSGIKLLDKGGRAYAEVEDDEVIKDGNKVFSDTLKTKDGVTYAEAAEKLAKQKGKVETNSTNIFRQNTAQRKTQILDSKEDKLFQEQENSKLASNPQYAKLGATLQQSLPYLDNAVNAILTATTPKVPKPQFIKAANLETDINVNDQLNDVNRAVDANARTIENNTSNSTAARNAISATRLQGAGLKSKIKTNEQNSEIQLRNQDAMNKQSVAQANASVTNNYRNMQLQRKGAIQSRISDNVSNLADDFVEKKNFDEASRYNNESLAAIKAMYSNGIADRADLKMADILELLRNKKK